MSEDTSDLQTDNQEVQSFFSKRKVNVPYRYISSEEEESVDNRPTKLKKTFLNTIEKIQENTSAFRQSTLL